eukprot:13816308-Alexandrium_andersonii.AAC.1
MPAHACPASSLSPLAWAVSACRRPSLAVRCLLGLCLFQLMAWAVFASHRRFYFAACDLPCLPACNRGDS